VQLLNRPIRIKLWHIGLDYCCYRRLGPIDVEREGKVRNEVEEEKDDKWKKWMQRMYGKRINGGGF